MKWFLPEPGGPGLVLLLHCTLILLGDLSPPNLRPLSLRSEEHVRVRGITGTELDGLIKQLFRVFDLIEEQTVAEGGEAEANPLIVLVFVCF